MALLQFACPHCQGVFQVDDSLGGQTVACPHCQGHVQVAGHGPAPSEMPSAARLPREPSRFPEPPSFPGQSNPPRSAAQQPASPPSLLPPRPSDGHEVKAETTSPATLPGRPKFQVVCGKCTGSFRSNPAMVGQQVLCPYCNARLLVPEGGGRAEPVDVSPVSAPVAPSHPTNVEPGRAIVIEKPIEPQPGTSKSSTGASSASATEETARKQDHSIFRPAAGDEIVDPELAVKDEGTRLVKVGDQYVEIRRLSPEEKAARRFKRNIIMVVMAAVVLGVVIFFLVER